MKLLAAALAALVLAPIAGADARTDKQIRLLQKQVKTLAIQTKKQAAQITALQKRVTVAEREARYAKDYSRCLAAWDADAFHRTWAVTDLLVEHLTGAKHFGPQARVDDDGACERVGVARSLTAWQIIVAQPR